MLVMSGNDQPAVQGLSFREKIKTTLNIKKPKAANITASMIVIKLRHGMLRLRFSYKFHSHCVLISNFPHFPLILVTIIIDYISIINVSM
jgi:hypothetical protein